MEIKNNRRGFQEINMATPAVRVQNACKRYGEGVPILSNFNMTVQRGTIYGLLGASGCGKTTILSCIVGLKELDSGEISVFGTRPGTKESGIPGMTVGYMPQEIALYQTFSIKEILYYFGRIYDMTQTEIFCRMEFLTNFLDLPTSTRIIGSLSGGQQRRTSLAVAMIHEPKLLILDEPTVGVDPLIRENIWQYLGEMVERRQTTVIITTHYIEEARQSNTVGLMRNGRLLVEKPPQLLLDEYETNLLEDIVLKLCKKDDPLANAGNNICSDEIKDAILETSFYPRTTINLDIGKIGRPDRVVGLKYKSRSPDYDTLFRERELQNNMAVRRHSVAQKGNRNSNMNKIVALAIRNFILLYRNPLLLVLIIAIPTIQIVLMNVMLSGVPKDTKFGLVNNELMTPYMESCASRTGSCLNTNMSCDLIGKLSESFSLNEFSSEAEALTSVQSGESWGYLSIPANFTEHMKYRSLWKNFLTNETIDGTTISIRTDMSDSLQSSLLMKSLYGNYQHFIKKIVSNCGGDSRIAELPLNFNAVYGTLDGKYVEYFQPAQFLVILFLIPLIASVTLVLDRKAGTLDRTMVAGVNFTHYFIAVMISELTLIILEITVCIGVAVLFFGFTVKGLWVLAILISVLTAMCGLSFGLLVGTICAHEMEAILCVLAFYLPIVLLSGVIWPLEAVRPWLRMICYIQPLSLPIESFRSIVSRGWGITHQNVWPGFAVIIVWISVFLLLTAIVNRFKK